MVGEAQTPGVAALLVLLLALACPKASAQSASLGWLKTDYCDGSSFNVKFEADFKKSMLGCLKQAKFACVGVPGSNRELNCSCNAALTVSKCPKADALQQFCPGWLLEQNVNYRGNNLVGYPVNGLTSASSCGKRCATIKSANAFSYSYDLGRCWCKTSGRPVEPAAAAGMVSGFLPSRRKGAIPGPPVDSPGDTTFAGPHQLPLATRDRWIIDARGARVHLAGVNWPGHMEPLIPEGLQHASLANIVNLITSKDFNVVRLTYSIEGALQGETTTLRQAMLAAGAKGNWSAAAQKYVDQIAVVNPNLVDATLDEVFTAVVNALGQAGVMTILDNHVSTAKWCCSVGDGNDYWDVSGTGGFNPDQWLAGITRMAQLFGNNPYVIGFSPRNELRGNTTDSSSTYYTDLLESATRPPPVWQQQMTKAANAIATNAPKALIVVGGLAHHTNHKWIAASPFHATWPGRVVYEAHWFGWSSYWQDTYDCDGIAVKGVNESVGFVLESGRSYTAPLLITAWGNSQWEQQMQCVQKYMQGRQLGWAWWTVNGDYYVREGQPAYEEGFGLLYSNMTGYQNDVISKNLRSLRWAGDAGHCVYCDVAGFSAVNVCSPNEYLAWDEAVAVTISTPTAGTSPTMRLAVKGTSFSNGAGLLLTSQTSGSGLPPVSDLFELIFIGNFEYQVRRAPASNACVENGRSSSSGAALMLWQCNGLEHQKWLLSCGRCSAAGVSSCKLMNKFSGLCMDWDASQGVMVQQPCNALSTQGTFVIEKTTA